MKGDQVVRMTPSKEGQANHGHSCVKGRFAWGYASHSDRVLKPMVRDKVSDPWREVIWEEAIGYAASRFKQTQVDADQNPEPLLHPARGPPQTEPRHMLLIRGKSLKQA